MCTERYWDKHIRIPGLKNPCHAANHPGLRRGFPAAVSEVLGWQRIVIKKGLFLGTTSDSDRKQSRFCAVIDTCQLVKAKK
jgi:hypothetical protein